MQEWRAAERKLGTAVKRFDAWATNYVQTQYLLSAKADKVALDPMGMVLVEGLSVYGNYFRDALDKLGVNVHVFRVGEYKSAVEPFLRNDMSAEARQADQEWLGELGSSYGHQVAVARGLPDSAVGYYV